VRRVLRPGGQYATLGGGALDIIQAIVVGAIASRAGNRWTGLMLWWKPFHAPDVQTITEMVLAGTLRSAIDRTFSLDETQQAPRWVDEGHPKGKVLIRVATQS
jgi:NADPH:quinone reductase-like Zn-dependent oxidoreductase